MIIEMKDELELSAGSFDEIKEKEISDIVRLFKFSNLNLIISDEKGEIVYGSAAFSNLSGFFIKELVKKNLSDLFDKKFTDIEISKMKKEIDCFDAMRILKMQNGKKITVNTYSSIMKEFQNLYIVSILVPSPSM